MITEDFLSNGVNAFDVDFERNIVGFVSWIEKLSDFLFLLGRGGLADSGLGSGGLVF